MSADASKKTQKAAGTKEEIEKISSKIAVLENCSRTVAEILHELEDTCSEELLSYYLVNINRKKERRRVCAPHGRRLSVKRFSELMNYLTEMTEIPLTEVLKSSQEIKSSDEWLTALEEQKYISLFLLIKHCLAKTSEMDFPIRDLPEEHKHKEHGNSIFDFFLRNRHGKTHKEENTCSDERHQRTREFSDKILKCYSKTLRKTHDAT